MERLWRNPLLHVGLFVFALGIGNCLVSWSKVQQYSSRLNAERPTESRPLLSDFPELTPQISNGIQSHLHRGLKESSLASAKVDFYSVVNTGGRILVVCGALLVIAVLAWSWRAEPRLNEPAPR